ncbi:serine hydrolase [Williamsia soli]|uniref:serine hydrolase n=1 Tax=Williamsia soli TaxID=364929 RepID=UPI001A9EB997|nr:serine hydrolase [Williamsia soli]
MTVGHPGSAVGQRLREIFADAGCAAWLHARTIGRTPEREFGWYADDPVVMASVYKLPLLAALCVRADRGDVNLRDTVTVDPRKCAEGPTGIATLHDPITLSWRDLAVQMMVVSDNAAADVILAEVGLGGVREVLDGAGLHSTHVVGGMAQVQQQLLSDTGSSTVAEAFAALADVDRTGTISAYDPALTGATTAREATCLLDLIWTDRVASAGSCDFIRTTMRKQAWKQRISSGFPLGIATVAGKTGTLGAIRNEVAVVEYPGEHPVAVAVFTHAARSELSLPTVEAAIGQAARVAVNEVRSAKG